MSPSTPQNAERLTFGPISTYLEYVVLPLIGPSSYLLYRRVAPLGLGTKTGPKSPMVKALARLELFGLGAVAPT